MGWGTWFSENWFNVLSAVSIVGGLWFTAFSLYAEAKTSRIANLLTLTANYRELWENFTHKPELARVLDASADLSRQPPTRDEEVFVNMMIQHVNSVYQAMKSGLTISHEGLRRDVEDFFSLPVPHAVWKSMKQFQDESLVEFIEANRSKK